MVKTGTLVALSLFLLSSVGVASSDAELDGYYADLVAYFGESTSTLTEVLAFDPKPEDVPIIFLVSQVTGTSARNIAELRTRGDGWEPIMNVRGAKPSAVYFRINVDFESKTYSPIFDKFAAEPDAEWGKIALTDDDIMNMVNLRFIYRRLGYSVFEVMAMRDEGNTFPTIHRRIVTLKKEALKKERAERRKASKEANREE